MAKKDNSVVPSAYFDEFYGIDRITTLDRSCFTGEAKTCRLEIPTIFSSAELKLLTVIANGIKPVPVVYKDDCAYLQLESSNGWAGDYPINQKLITSLVVVGSLQPDKVMEFLHGFKMSPWEQIIAGRINKGCAVTRDDEYYYVGDEKLPIAKYRFYFDCDVDCQRHVEEVALTSDELQFLAFSVKLGINSKVVENDDGTIVMKMNERPGIVTVGVPFSRSAVNKVTVNGKLTFGRVCKYLKGLIMSGEEARLVYQVLTEGVNFTEDKNYYYIGHDSQPLSLEKYRFYFGNTPIDKLKIEWLEKKFIIQRDVNGAVLGFTPRSQS